MRAVIDTNVLISALIRRQGVSGAVLGALTDNRFTAIYTTEHKCQLKDFDPAIWTTERDEGS